MIGRSTTTLLYNRYGPSQSLDDYLLKARSWITKTNKAEYEGFCLTSGRSRVRHRIVSSRPFCDPITLTLPDLLDMNSAGRICTGSFFTGF